MNKLILFAFCLLTVVSFASSIEISCAYSMLHFYVVKNIYSCFIRRVNSPDVPTVSVSGFHMHAKGLDDVQGLKGDIGSLQKFPRDINNTFKNLIAVHFTNGQIKELSSEDLNSFPDLVELYFDNNKIEVIEEGTFDFNPKLAGISFMNNKIMHISPNVFDHLTDLNYLWLNGNPCQNGVAGNDRNAVLNIITTAKSSCQNQALLRMEHKNNLINSRNLGSSEDINQKIDSLKTKFEAHEQEMIEFKAAVMKMLNDFEVDHKNMHSEMMRTIQQKLTNSGK